MYTLFQDVSLWGNKETVKTLPIVEFWGDAKQGDIMPDAVVLGEAEVGGDKSKNSLEEEEKQKAGYQHDNERDPYFDTLNIWVWVLLGGSDDVKLFN